MDELKARLAAIGLSPEQIDQALETIAAFAKEKLPADFAGMVDEVMAGQKPDLAQIAGKLMGGFRGFFGR